jgi:hypothetical protein
MENNDHGISKFPFHQEAPPLSFFPIKWQPHQILVHVIGPEGGRNVNCLRPHITSA